MLVFPDVRIVLLAVPKTGSTALELAFGPHAGVVLRQPPTLNHLGLNGFDRNLRPLLERADGGARFETVAVVREPIDWLGSWYRYRLRDEIAGTPTSTRGMDFDRFVRDCMSAPAPPHASVGRQSRLVVPAPDRRVDHLFRYDRIEALVDFLAARIGVAPPLPRRNVSPPAPLDLAAETEAHLRAAFAEDFALYESLADRA